MNKEARKQRNEKTEKEENGNGGIIMNNNNAKTIPCELLYKPTDPNFEEPIRQFQGCPTIAVTRGGRVYLGWYSGGTREPHMDNYNLLIYSDDCQNWSNPLLVIPSSKEHCIHALDIQLWISPEGKLHVFWVQNNTIPASDGLVPEKKKDQPLVQVDGYWFPDFEHAMWVSVCENPDDDEPVFSSPRYLDKGFLRCKPLVLKNGRWLNFNYDQTSTRYGYSISDDCGKTYEHHYGAEKISTVFDESMAYEREDGSIRMLARSYVGKLGESISYDGGETWEEAVISDIDNPDTRFFVARTPSGRVLLVNNDAVKEQGRTNMSVYLSEDDGDTWKYQRLIDDRMGLSYPDVDFHDGKIYLTYDRERTGAKEILFAVFTEEDIMNPDYQFEISIVSKP